MVDSISLSIIDYDTYANVILVRCRSECVSALFI